MAAMRRIPQQMRSLRAGPWQGGLGPRSAARPSDPATANRHAVAGYGRFAMNVLVLAREASRPRAQADGYAAATTGGTFDRQSATFCRCTCDSSRDARLCDRGGSRADEAAALLVNTSRAELIEPGALDNALRAGSPGFAAVDVYEEEPVRDAHPAADDGQRDLHAAHRLCDTG